ncbi:cysteine hydrolase family protein [Rhizobium lusitanum]|uniref:cysteine hydrolase family protein n=1 Tax=Rhizobium lusitanum TaxID=293958 RepID=UPI00195B2FBA|nr:isochorismatase family cysteine hydrolase [Rhizobium lusitanum]MBM7046561.1 cysteine hydrolase [Rhizobium lusitanum]
MTNFSVNPKTTALINVDIQNCFVQDSPVAAPGGAAIIPRINKLADAVRRTGGLVIHTAHVVRPDGSTTGVMGEFNAAIKAGLLYKGRPSAELHPDLAIAETDLVVDKPRYGAFYGTDVELILRNRGIESVIVTGITTNVCCETTAREANMRDFQVFFISDGTATFDLPDVSAEQVQKAVCATLAMAFAQIETADSMIAKLDSGVATTKAA